MKFDCIIMNPPYQRNLHLKILAEAIKHLKDDGTCVNLSPDSWLINPFKKFEKDKHKRNALETLSSYIQEHESYTAAEFNRMFGTCNFFGVGIVKLSSTPDSKIDFNKFDCKDELLCKIVAKVMSLPSLRSHYVRTGGRFFVQCRRRTHRYLPFCDWDDNKVKARDGIDFASAIERDNFKASILNTWLYRWLDKSEWTDSENSTNAPWLGDCTNMRTGKKGYEGEWTDDDLYKLFNLTKDEIKIIEDTMKKYEAK